MKRRKMGEREKGRRKKEEKRKKKGGENKRYFTGNRTQDLSHGWLKL